MNASRDDLKEGNVLALRGARVSDYGGKTLNSGGDHSSLFVDPLHKRTD
jgi:hypothetical protein